MPTYDYECTSCGLRFERRQAITEAPVTQCPQCRGAVRRLISGGLGFILRGAGRNHAGHQGSECALERVGKTCCGRDQRCGKPACGDRS
jgi:putative FmdB family regulatory protein